MLAPAGRLWDNPNMNIFAELEQALDPARPIFTVEGARRLVEMPPNAEKMARMEELADKAEDGSLTQMEHGEYESLVHAAKLLSILRLKAGLFLQHFKAA